MGKMANGAEHHSTSVRMLCDKSLHRYRSLLSLLFGLKFALNMNYSVGWSSYREKPSYVSPSRISTKFLCHVFVSHICWARTLLTVFKPGSLMNFNPDKKISPLYSISLCPSSRGRTRLHFIENYSLSMLTFSHWYCSVAFSWPVPFLC
jgi:hypothetical protein